MPHEALLYITDIGEEIADSSDLRGGETWTGSRKAEQQHGAQSIRGEQTGGTRARLEGEM